MSIFKTSGVILKIDKIGEKNFVYTIFSNDYGKIRANKKISTKEKTLDLGYLVNFEVQTKQNIDIHKIRNIKIVSEFLNQKRNFSQINSYLIFLSIIHKKAPDGVPIYELFEVVDKVNKTENIGVVELTLSSLKVLSIFGELKLEHKDETITKILRFIDSSKIGAILKLKGINDELQKKLENIL